MGPAWKKELGKVVHINQKHAATAETELPSQSPASNGLAFAN